MKHPIIWIAAILVVLIGGYFLYTSMSQQADQAGAPSDEVQAQEVVIGTGATASPGSRVSVLYRGQLQDGTVFDSSEAHGNVPLDFVLGAPGMIAGFQIGVNGMKEGGERVIAIPPVLGYGDQDVKDASGKVVIPANSTIIFNVKLLKVEAAATSTTQ